MAAQVPPAPALSPEAFLLVFVHHTAPPAGASDPMFGDCERLRVLGRSMLRAAYAAAILNRNSTLHAQEFVRHLDETLPGFVARWVTAYDWRRKMRAVPLHVNLHDSEETMRIFETYVGAVAAQQSRIPRMTSSAHESRLSRGDDLDVFAWIQTLVDAP